MTRRIDWKEIAEAVGVVAIVVSLVFVGLQMRQTQSIAQSEILSVNVGNRIAANTAIAEHAGIWARASAELPLTDEEEVVVDRLIDSLSVERVALALHFQQQGLEDTADLILTDYAGVLAAHPGIYRRWLAREDRFAADRRVVMGEEHSLREWGSTMRSRVEAIRQARSHDKGDGGS